MKDKKLEVIIYETTNYDQFKKIVGNRDVRINRLNKVTQKIMHRNLLKDFYLLVNEDFELIDGQHRLQAAKNLKLSVFYKIIPGLRLEHIQSINTANSAWDLKDVLKSHVDRGHANYIVVNEFVNKYKFGISTSIMMIGTKDFSDTERLVNDFKDGLFVPKFTPQAIRVAEFLQDLKPYMNPFVYNNRNFLRVVIKLHLQNKIDGDTFIKKLEKSRRRIPALQTSIDYYRFFEDIYSINMKRRVRLY